MTLENGVWAWYLSLSYYFQGSCRNVQKYESGVRWKLPNQTPNPFSMVYAPELDTYPVIVPSLVYYYQYQIVVLRWMVELGQVDINTEVSMLDS